MKTINVIAKPGCICPREIPQESVISDREAVAVPETTYYTRLIADGSLKIVRPAIEQKKKEATPPKKTGDDK